MPKSGTHTKAHIVDAVAEANGFTHRKSVETIETLFELIKSTLESGEDVLISGFGRFCVKQKAERCGRNPATGKDMMLAPRKVVTFKWSGMLKNKLNSKNHSKKEAEMAKKKERDIEKTYTTKQMVAKLRRLADSLENGKQYKIQITGEKISIPTKAVFNIEHARGKKTEEVEFQFKWEL